MAKIQADFIEHDDHGLVLRTLTSGRDQSEVTFADGPLFHLLAREIGGSAGNVAVLSGASSNVFGPADGLGPRDILSCQFKFGTIAATGVSPIVYLEAAVLDAVPDRVLFSLALAMGGPSTLAWKWCSPIQLRLQPFASGNYCLGAAGGMVTRAPEADLTGDAASYEFSSYCRHEPEVNTDDTSRMEAWYPGEVSLDCSAYGSRTTGETLILHGDLSGQGCRLRDWYDGSAMVLTHEVLCEDPVTARNGGKNGSPITNFLVVSRYAGVFFQVGDVMGEEVGLEWRRWFFGSSEGSELLPTRPRDTAESFYSQHLWCDFSKHDDEQQTNLTKEVIEEYRLFLGASASLPRRPQLYNDFSEQDSSANHPADVSDVMPDLFDAEVDGVKSGFTNSLEGDGLETTMAVEWKSPQPHDGRSYFENDGGNDLSPARFKTISEAEDSGYQSVDDWRKVSGTVSTATYDGSTFTILKLVGTKLDEDQWDVFTTYELGVHALHAQHLGWCKITNGGGTRYYSIERQNETEFKSNPSEITVMGNKTGEVTTGDPIEIYWMPDHSLPGYQDAETELCLYADDHGSGVTVPTRGPQVRLLSDLSSDFAGNGLVLLGDHRRTSCMASSHALGTDTYAHTPGSNAVPQAHRRILSALWAAGWSPLLEERGPSDYLVGRSQGCTATYRRNLLTTSEGSWAAAPLFQAALGDFLPAGIYLNEGLGHLTTAVGKAGWSLYESAGITGGVREAIAFDWLSGKLLTIAHRPDATGKMGDKSRPDRQDSYTPLWHETLGIEDTTTVAALVGRLLRVQLELGMIPQRMHRVRSLRVRGAQVSTGNWPPVGFEDHNLPSSEIPFAVQHGVFQDSTDPRKLWLVLVNPSQNARSQVFGFYPDWYSDTVPGYRGGYSITKHTVDPLEVTETDEGTKRGPWTVMEALGPSEVVVYEITFSSSLRLVYRYDDGTWSEEPLDSALHRNRVEEIHGHGHRFQYGFLADLPDEQVNVSKVSLRVRGLGRSETQ
jgi:hypothetical protein